MCAEVNADISNVFLYGTLQHMGLLETVIGHAPRERLHAAELDGFAVSRAKGHGFPLIQPQEGGVAEGLLLTDVTAQERASLDHYELGFGYKLHPVEVRMGADQTQTKALVYMPEPDLWQADGPWSLETWGESDWPHVQHSSKEIMSYMGSANADDLAQRFPMIGARAQARAQALQNPAPQRLRSQKGQADVSVESRTVRHFGFFRTDAYQLKHKRFDGMMSPTLEREVFMAADAALVLPYDPKRGNVMLIEQFRMGVFARGDAHPWVLEPVAGRIDAGETPEEAARRECVEEVELVLEDLRPIGQCYPSPGEVSTYFYMFLGLADLPESAPETGGLSLEDEDIRRHILKLDEALALVESGEINIGPLIQMLQWLALNQARFASAG